MKMTNGEIFAMLLTISRRSPEHADAASSVMQYISQLHAVAVLAKENLEIAALKLRDDSVIPHNAEIVAAKLAELSTHEPSHGSDI